MAIPTVYTGQNSGAAPIYGGGRGVQALQSGLKDLSGLKQQDVALARQDAKEFRKDSVIDPVQVGHDKVMLNQADDIQRFQDEWSGIMRDRQGKLTEHDKMRMASDKAALKSKQGMWQQGYNQYLQDLQRYTANPRRYDADAFNRGVEAYASGDGSYTQRLLEVGPMPSDDYNYLFIRSGKAAQSVDMTDAQIRNDITSKVLGDDSTWKRAAINFEGLPSAVKQDYLDRADRNNDGVVDRDEQQNAIVEYEIAQRAPLYRKKPVVAKPTAAEKNKAAKDAAELEAAKPENLIKEGVDFQRTGYGWKYDGGDFKLMYKPTNKVRSFSVDAKDVGMDVPAGAIVTDGKVNIYPDKIGEDGVLYASIDTPSKGDLIQGRKRKRQIRKSAEKQGITNGVVTDNEKQYVIDDKGVIYAAGKDMAKKDIKIDYEKAKPYFHNYFDSLDDVVQWKMGQAPAPTAAPTPAPSSGTNWDEYKRKGQ